MTAGGGRDTGGKRRKPRVAVIYHMFPHYRAGVMRALARSSRYDFSFHGSHEPLDGILAFTGDETVAIQPLGFRPMPRGGGWFTGLWRTVFSRDNDALIIIGNPRFPQTWFAALAGRLLGKAVFFWAHGWLRRYDPFRAWLRHVYFHLANGVLVYSDRAKSLAAAAGFPAERVHPIYNSLDWDASSAFYEALMNTPDDELRRSAGISADRPLVICTARLTALCRFDLLIEAARRLKQQGRPIDVILIGDGPLRESLEALAVEAGVDVTFTGAIYDEAVLSRMLYLADMTASPGKVGLTAMHSLSYGTPVVTHDALDRQMPEVEAVIPGVTGALFAEGDPDSLAAGILQVLDWDRPRDDVRQACRAVIARRYTPDRQRDFIEAALDQALKS